MTTTMTEGRYSIVDRQEILDKFARDDNFLLWNVAAEQGYDPKANIKGSAWIPSDQIRETVRRQKVAKNQEVITYCSGPACPDARDAAVNLVGMGFKKVSLYEGGLEDWAKAGQPLGPIVD